jgi:magnesium dechelatase
MGNLNPDKLHLTFRDGVRPDGPPTPRAYTLTHSDMTGDLFLTIGKRYNSQQISGWYTRFMRDEVLAEWRDGEQLSLHVHCHASGGLVFGSSSYREAVFRHHLPMVLEAFRYGEQELINVHPQLAQTPIFVHFHARQKKYDKTERWGILDDY